jgi:hypothetical protein
MPPKRGSNSASNTHVPAPESVILDYAILPRRKAGQSSSGERLPVRLTKEVLERYFGMPLIQASKELVRHHNLEISNKPAYEIISGNLRDCDQESLPVNI